MSSRVGVPADLTKGCLITEGDIVVCPSADDQEFDFAGLRAAIAADGAQFKDPNNPDADPVPFDPANEDHKVFYANVSSYYCGSDPCKTGILVTSDGACVVEEDGEIKSLMQGGQEWLGGVNNDSNPGNAIDEGDVVQFPAGSAGKICYGVCFCPS